MWFTIFLTLFISSATGMPYSLVGTLWPGGASVTSPNGCYSVSLDNSCNVVLKQGNDVYWSSGSMYSGIRPCNNVQMQDDGNFVLYSKGNGIATWATGTDRNDRATLHIQDDGNLVIYTSGNQPIWASWSVLNQQLSTPCPAFPGSTLYPGQQLGTQQSLYSPNKAYRMVVQGDGNLVVYNVLTARPFWASNTVGSGADRLTFKDGKVLLQDQSGATKFSIDRNNGAKLTMQDDGNLVLYTNEGSATWAYTGKPIRDPIWPFRKMIGQYLLLTDDTTSYNTGKNWSPQLFPYQQSTFNVLFFSFVNVNTLDVPISFQNLAKTRGTDKPGAIPKDTIIIFSLGGGEEKQWKKLTKDPYGMARTVASWYQNFNCDGIDIDHEHPNDASHASNLVTFINEVKRLAPNMIITQPVYGSTSNDVAVSKVVNQNNWGNNGDRGGLIDSVGVMVYDSSVYTYVDRYTSLDPEGQITKLVPNNAMVLGASGVISNNELDNLVNKVKEKNYFGIMVWYGSVKDPEASRPFTYGGDDGSVDSNKNPNSNGAFNSGRKESLQSN